MGLLPLVCVCIISSAAGLHHSLPLAPRSGQWKENAAIGTSLKQLNSDLRVLEQELGDMQLQTVEMPALERIEPATVITVISLGVGIITGVWSWWADRQLTKAREAAAKSVQDFIEESKKLLLSLRPSLESMVEFYKQYLENEQEQTQMGYMCLMAASGAAGALESLDSFFKAVEGGPGSGHCGCVGWGADACPCHPDNHKKEANVLPSEWQHQYKQITDIKKGTPIRDGLILFGTTAVAASLPLLASKEMMKKAAEMAGMASDIIGDVMSEYNIISSAVQGNVIDSVKELASVITGYGAKITGNVGQGMASAGVAVGVFGIAWNLANFAQEMEKWWHDMEFVATDARESTMDLHYMLCKTLVPVMDSNLKFESTLTTLMEGNDMQLDTQVEAYTKQLCQEDNAESDICVALKSATGNLAAKVQIIKGAHDKQDTSMADKCKNYWVDAKNFTEKQQLSRTSFDYVDFPVTCGKPANEQGDFRSGVPSKHNGPLYGPKPGRVDDDVWGALGAKGSCSGAKSVPATAALSKFNSMSDCIKKTNTVPAAGPRCLKGEPWKGKEAKEEDYRGTSGKWLSLDYGCDQQYITQLKLAEWSPRTRNVYSFNYMGHGSHFREGLENSGFKIVQSKQYPWDMSDSEDAERLQIYMFNGDEDLEEIVGDPKLRWLSSMNDMCFSSYDENRRSIHLYQAVVLGSPTSGLPPPIVGAGVITKKSTGGSILQFGFGARWYNDRSTKAGQVCFPGESETNKNCFVDTHINLLKDTGSVWDSFLWVSKDYRIPVPTRFLQKASGYGTWPSLTN